ncbi:MAG: BatD family protein [Planctomycetota bacterium]|nr:BatD family protein [Planctomycetota bacterium]
MTRHGRRTVRLTALLTLVATAVEAQELRLSLSSTVSYGDKVRLELEVVDWPRGEGRPAPHLPDVPGLAIEGPYSGGFRSNTQIVRGRSVTTSATVFVYRVTPLSGRTGTFTLGPVTVRRRGGQVLGSNTVKLGVYKRPELGLRFRAQLSRTSGDVGEPFRVTYTLSYPRGAPADSEALNRTLGDMELPVAQVGGTIRRPVKARPGERAVRLRRQDTELLVHESFVRNADGTAEEALVFAFELTPLRPGEITIDAAKARMEMRTGREKIVRHFVFGPRRVPETAVFSAETQALTYAVNPLPRVGQPAGFTGAVGHYTVRIKASPTEVKTFEPITLTVTVKGSGLLEELTAPDWTQIPELTRHFDVRTDVDAGEAEGDTKVFRQVIRPLDDQVTEIPSLPFPFYDPSLHRYSVAHSESIPIVVHPAKTVSSEDIVTRPGGVTPESPTQAPRSITAVDGVAANFAEIGSARSFSDPRSAVLGLPFLLAAGIPPLLFLLVALALRSARRRPEERTRAQAYGKARTAIRAAGGDHERLSRAFQDYFRERLGLPPGEITPAQLGAELERVEVPREVAERACRQLEELLESRFGGLSASADPFGSNALDILREVEACRPGR